MSLFKKKMKRINRSTEEPAALGKVFNVLNCTPQRYLYTKEYMRFVNNAESNFEKGIREISVDELCGDMYDAYIDSVTEQMKGSAKEQYTEHLYLIRHHRGILDGELTRARGHLSDLKQEFEEIEQEIGKYKEIKKEKNIL